MKKLDLADIRPPRLYERARDEGFDEIGEWLETLARAEKSHAGRFGQGLEQLS